ncbi:hypothetical protein GCM10009672_25180 [Nesterenkonia lutea]
MTRPVPADWLDERRRADHRAREKAAPLIDALTETLRGLTAVDDAASVRVIDVGAGTGSNQAWLAPRLHLSQRWTLLDHDADLLDVASQTPADSEVRETVRVLGTVDDLPGLTSGEEVQLVTCSALLDLLSLAEAEVLADAIAGPRAGRDVAALLSLSVTGAVEIHPAHESDAVISQAFDAHQRRGDLLGPDAAGIVAELLRERGAQVSVGETDWLLDTSDAALITRYLSDRADVAVENDPSLASTAAAWLQVRQQQLATGDLQVRVGHVDLLALPARSQEP